jgi:transposase
VDAAILPGREGRLRLRSKDDLPPAHLTIRSPYDHEAHYGHKRDLSWFGYKVHFSETCDEQLPHLITHVTTTDATQTDIEHTEAIHQALALAERLPGTQRVRCWIRGCRTAHQQQAAL